MSELTETVRKMLSQAQVFARDTPFEAVARATQAVQLIDGALTKSAGPDDRTALDNLRQLAAGRLTRYQEQLARWVDASRNRGEAYNQRESEIIGLPLRAKG